MDIARQQQLFSCALEQLEAPDIWEQVLTLGPLEGPRPLTAEKIQDLRTFLAALEISGLEFPEGIPSGAVETYVEVGLLLLDIIPSDGSIDLREYIRIASKATIILLHQRASE